MDRDAAIQLQVGTMRAVRLMVELMKGQSLSRLSAYPGKSDMENMLVKMQSEFLTQTYDGIIAGIDDLIAKRESEL